jgi:hypothetical protein
MAIWMTSPPAGENELRRYEFVAENVSDHDIRFTVAVGYDDDDMFAEVRAAHMMQRVHGDPRDPRLRPAEVFGLAWDGGAEVIGAATAVGRLEPQKRQELLIDAMRFVRTPIKLVLAGGSADSKHYESIVKRAKVGNRVTLRGFVPDEELVQLYANALAVCYLPFDEDYGYVTLEGMLSGKPVLVTADSGGAAELIEHDRDGLVVEPEAKAIAASPIGDLRIADILSARESSAKT